MATGLSVNRAVNVDIYLSPKAVPRRNFGVLCVAGDSDVISGLERIRYYTTLDAIADDFGLDASEYKAAELYYSQTPKPVSMAIGRWLQSATPGILRGGAATSEIDPWKAITDGAMKIEVDGVEASLTTLNFSSATNMNGVASVISAALTSAGQSGATCTWDGGKFIIETKATGTSAFMGYATSPAAGTDISSMTGLTQAKALPLIPGYAAETPAECAAKLADVSGEWYGFMFAADATITDEQLIDVSKFIEGSSKSRIHGVTCTDARMLDSTFTTDIGSKLKELGLNRSVVQYSANPYAAASLFGRAFTVNFNGNKTTITLKFKQQPGVVAETLTESQAKTLENKNVNVFVNYDNDTAILQEGVVSSGAFFDEIHGLDWLQNALQTAIWNLKYQSKTKIPQEEDGVTQIIARMVTVLDGARTNGLVGPGTWNADGFGQLLDGDYLPKGYYIYSQPIDDQAQSEREQRKAPPCQVAVKLAGAIHFTNVMVNVNR